MCTTEYIKKNFEHKFTCIKHTRLQIFYSRVHVEFRVHDLRINLRFQSRPLVIANRPHPPAGRDLTPSHIRPYNSGPRAECIRAQATA